MPHGSKPDAKPFYDRAFGKRPAHELYDLRSDPHELKNLAEDPAYAATVKELDARLMTELETTGEVAVAVGGRATFYRRRSSRRGRGR